MEVKYFYTLSDAIRSVLKNHTTYDLIMHSLHEGVYIPDHYHKKANEWLIVFNGTCLMETEEDTRTFFYEGKYKVIFLPKETVHSIRAITKIYYFVIRDRKGRTIYCKQ
jgi:quercetin dioxygenase-like cupin family protein